MKTYAERVSRFWEWFQTQEPQLSDSLKNARKYGSDRVLGLFGSGLNQVIDGIGFEVGDAPELNLVPRGNQALYFLTTRLVSARPDSVKSGWTVTPWKPPLTGSPELGVGETRIRAEDVWVRVEHEKGRPLFSVSFYSERFQDLDHREAVAAFLVLLDKTIGENVAVSHVGLVLQAEAPSEDMIPLCNLRRHMEKTLADENQELLQNPCHLVTRYRAAPVSAGLRSDELAGFSMLPALLKEYYDGSGTTWDRLAGNGAKAVFLTYLHEEADPAEALDIRYEIAERIENEVLGEEGSGREIGVVIGQACGTERCYIDLLLYDEPAFLARIGPVLDQYHGEFELVDFRAGGERRKLPE